MKADDLRRAKDFDLVACSAADGVALSAWPGEPEHVGVWLERCYLEEGESKKEKPVRSALYRRAVEALRKGKPAFETWRSQFERVKRDLAAGAISRRYAVIEAKSRVLLHPASNASVTDGAVLLHHTYGVPYLPGSGLKGVARAWMRRTVDLDERSARRREAGERWGSMRSDARDQDMVRALFGSIPREGAHANEPAFGAAVEFHDALWIPEAPPDAKADWSPLSVDVLNPHQSGYYTGKGDPGDASEPVPTHRLTVSPRARFLVMVEGVTPDADAWAGYALDTLLLPALASAGFGAWTGAGYGRFAVVETKGIEGGAMSHPPSAQPAEEWHEVTLTLDPGSGRLTALLPGPTRPRAEVSGRKASELRATLPPDLRDRLQKKRELTIKVRVQKVGNSIQIVELKA